MSKLENDYLQRGYVLVARQMSNSHMHGVDLVLRNDKELIFVQKHKEPVKGVAWFRKAFPQYDQLRTRIDVVREVSNE